MITVILVGVQDPGNLGAVARLIKNFGFSDLILIDPACSKKSKEAIDRASHAAGILAAAQESHIECLRDFDLVVGTTAQVGTDYNITRTPIIPSDLLKHLNPKANTAVVFGREATGLTNEELGFCDLVVTIPTADEYPTLNISHAVAIVLYELSRNSHGECIARHYRPMTSKEKSVIYGIIDRVIDGQHYQTPEKKETARKVLRRLVAKSSPTRREAFSFIGFLKRLV